MSSLRARLILAFALVALAPLAVSMLMLSQRIQSTVREQANERLAATLTEFRHRLRNDGDELAGRIRIVGRDPTLKRSYLTQPAGSRDLAESVAEKRFLLGLDFLAVVDTGGTMIAEESSSPQARAAGVDAIRALAGRRIESTPVIHAPRGVPAMILAASAPIPYQGASAGSVLGGVLLDARFLERRVASGEVELSLDDPAGSVVATTIREGATPSIRDSLPGRVRLDGGSYLTSSIPLETGTEQRLHLTGWVSTAAAERTIVALRTTSLLLGLLGLAIAVALGAIWSSQVSRPVEKLAAFSQRISRGEWDEPLAVHSFRELQTLVSALDRMRGDLRSYREKLRASERHAAWSQIARTLAHEVKNPLTPIAVSVADLKRSYDLKRPDFPAILDDAVRTIDEEVQSLKRLLQEFSDFGRLPEPSFRPCPASDLIHDLEALYRREVLDGKLEFSAPAPEFAMNIDRAQMRQALVNLIKNGLEAVDGKGRVGVSVRLDGRFVEWAVSDDGPGFSAEARSQLFVPDFTTKASGSGLGLVIVSRIVTDHDGSMAVAPGPGGGTRVRVRFPRDSQAAKE